jgi:hypothetical protein
MMIKDTVSQLYSFISKMMTLLERDLDNSEIVEMNDGLVVKKNMTTILHKLVALVLQLNKLSKDEQLYVCLLYTSPSPRDH